MPIARSSRFVQTAACLLAVLGTACHAGVNGSVNIPAGASADDAATVNGGVFVGKGANVGEARTVNGGVHIAEDVTAESVKTVNGGVHIASNTKVTRDVGTVNGGVSLGRGVDVGGDVGTVNGGIRLMQAHVAGLLTTYNGGIYVGEGSRVDGGIHVKRPRSIEPNSKPPRIVIGPGAVVGGTLQFDREVKLYVSQSAKIGRVEGASPILFSGDRPDIPKD